MKNHRKSDKMVCMKKIFMFLLCSVLVMAAVRIGMLRYQDKPEDFAGIEKWIDLGREKTQQINNSLSEKLSEQNWNFEGAYDIDDDDWFDEEGVLYSGNLEAAASHLLPVLLYSVVITVAAVWAFFRQMQKQ